ncbi:MAG: hypothetical protein JSW39_25005 [Desulfobacterales bacterium]|nr:MAG: hypothetical protein JSW39_25005 [Desulfobacterales bacterium]
MLNQFRRLAVMVMIVSATALGLSHTYADEKRDMQGWGEEDPYNQYYDVKEFEKFRGWVVQVKEVVPLPGMSPGVALDVRDGSEVIEVHLCPTWFAQPGDIGIKKGDRVKLKGCWAEIDGKDVFMASKVKKGEIFEFKVRLTKNGKPFWTMTVEELAAERSSAED